MFSKWLDGFTFKRTQLFFDHRTYTGQNPATLLVDAKNYDVLQVGVVSALVQKIWKGQSSFGTSMMYPSSSYQLLFRAHLD